MRFSLSVGRPPAARTALLVVATALLGLCGSAGALAQRNIAPPGPPNALQGFSQNRGQPVNIQADKLVVRDKDKMATFSGNVHVVQGDTEMRSKVLVVFYMDSGKPADAGKPAAAATTMMTSADQRIRRIEATGGVTVNQKDQNAAGENGIFDMQSNTVTLNGNVVVTHGKDVVRGQRLTVDLTTGVSHMDGRVEALFGTAPNGETNLPGPGPSPRSSRAN